MTGGGWGGGSLGGRLGIDVSSISFILELWIEFFLLGLVLGGLRRELCFL